MVTVCTDVLVKKRERERGEQWASASRIEEAHVNQNKRHTKLTPLPFARPEGPYGVIVLNNNEQ
jgi:hypothetical protein